MKTTIPKKVLAVFAHPDDEAFGPSGTLALWAKKGATIHLISATRGESGMNDSGENTGKLRSKELLESAKVIGITSVEFLDFIDGTIGNNDLAKLQEKITQKITEFKPDTIITFDLNGISGHIDHIAVASATTSSFLKSQAKKLYYVTILKTKPGQMDDYFIYVPQGKSLSEIDEAIDVSSVWETKMEANI